MLTLGELAQVDQAVNAYCAAKHIHSEGEKRSVRGQLLLMFTTRKRMNLRDEQAIRLTRLDFNTLTDILREYSRIE